MAQQPRVTLKQIAERAGCSVTAVSKTLNAARGTAAVGEATRQRVIQIAQEMGYTPSYLARALQRGRTQAVGLVLTFSRGRIHHNAYWGQLIQGVQARTCEADHDLLMISGLSDQAELERGLAHMRERRVDALIVPTLRCSASYRELLDQLDAPIVLLGGGEPSPHPVVESDLASGCQEAVAHLADLGHRSVLYVGLAGAFQERPRARAEILATAAAACGMTLHRTELTLSVMERDVLGVDGDVTTAAYADECRVRFAAALPDLPPATAVIAYSERVGFGVCAALTEAGLRVPEDVSVLAFDNIYSNLGLQPLTVVDPRSEEVGARAAELALQLIEAGDDRGAFHGLVEGVPSRLVVRASTGPVGQGW
jgi:DNA-binding LacI/PurR family transcriptional regulator